MCAENRSNSREFPLFAHELNAALKEGDSDRFIGLVGGLCRLNDMDHPLHRTRSSEWARQ